MNYPSLLAIVGFYAVLIGALFVVSLLLDQCTRSS